MKEYLKEIRTHFIFAAFFSLFINVLQLTFSIYMLAIYDRVLPSYSMPTLVTLTIMAIFALTVFGGLSFLRSRILIYAGNKIESRLNDRLLKSMVEDATRLQKVGAGNALSDLRTIRTYLSGTPITTLFDIPWTPLLLIVIYIMHPMMGLAATGGAILIILLSISQELLTRKRINEANDINSAGNRFVSCSLRNAEIINSLGMGNNIVARWNQEHQQSLEIQTKASKYAEMLQNITRSLRMSMQVVIYCVGAYLTLRHQSTAGIMIAGSIIMGRALAPIEQGMATWKQTIEARAAHKRLKALIQTFKDPDPMDLPSPTGKLDVEGVTLSLGGRIVLQNVSFSLEKGESLGLIGPSASGKTSLCRVLLGIWPSMSGKVRMDGASVFQWQQEQIGGYLGYLPQDIELFPGTVGENIARMGTVDSEKVVEAAKCADVHDMILKLPQGYDTPIGEGGSVLSGGQRQRIALARALYGGPVFVILDEPNSNLDDLGEKALVQTLQKMKEQRITTIMISHKPSLLGAVDKILILNNGQVTMCGPREEVFKQLMRASVPSIQKAQENAAVRKN
jgi:PrtD family type I secretion system ABC transporter